MNGFVKTAEWNGSTENPAGDMRLGAAAGAAALAKPATQTHPADCDWLRSSAIIVQPRQLSDLCLLNRTRVPANNDWLSVGAALLEE